MKIIRLFPLLLGLLLGGMLLTTAFAAPTQLSPSGKPAIYEFSRALCPVCAKMAAILKEVQARYGDQVEVRILHIETDEGLFNQYRVSFVPTQIFLDGSGREVFRNEGFFSKEEIVGKLKELGYIKE